MNETMRKTPAEEAQEKARKMMESARERWRVLSDCVNIIDANVRTFSQNDSGLVPRDGYELAFQKEKRKAEVVREMMREIRGLCGWS